MSSTTRFLAGKRALMAGAALLSIIAPAHAQQINSARLLELMVQKGLVSRAEADALIAEAGQSPEAAQASAAVPVGGINGDTQTIPYVPQVVRQQIKDELRSEVMQQAKSEGWAAPDEVAEWTKRIQIFGDVRIRAEGVLMEDGNHRLFPNFQRINSGSGFNVAGIENAPFLNTTEDRHRARIRARLGLRARLTDWISTEVRLATGSDNSPVSTNQTLGGGTNFGKYSLWLDRANIQLRPIQEMTIQLGRFGNPFHTTSLMFDDDLNFDGVAVSGKVPVSQDVAVFGTVGAFPVYNTSFDFGTTDVIKTKSEDKYMAAAQAGVAWKISDGARVKTSVGYFHFSGIDGRLSSPCFLPTSSQSCDTDERRPQFVQFGNTMAALRNIALDPTEPSAPQLQYFGLASRFRVLNANLQLDAKLTDRFGLRLVGDYAKNIGFQEWRARAEAVNNRGPNIARPGQEEVPGDWEGGDDAWHVNLVVGQPDLQRSGEWNLSLGYKHIESDAVVDAFTDSDFHLGGTNAKGFILGGEYALSTGTSLGVRWLSANEVSGPPYANDVLQIDLTARF